MAFSSMRKSSTNPTADLEKSHTGEMYMDNDTVYTLSWTSVTVTVKDKHSKESKDILHNIDGYVEAGEVLALMGPSGSGKTTLLNVLAGRQATSKARTEGAVLVNGRQVPVKTFQQLSSFVEQEDALIGSLSVEETLDFAARLALPSSISASDRKLRTESLIKSFGLQNQRDNLIGTPIRKGISGGQKRRVSVASQLITEPKILFLDEPTSGLDSTASYEVVQFLKDYAQKHRLLVVASIHQPSAKTFLLFDKLLLLSQGQICYSGPTATAKDHFASLGFSVPLMMSPAEYFLDMTNVDFYKDKETAETNLNTIHTAWATRQSSDSAQTYIGDAEANMPATVGGNSLSKSLSIPFILLHRLLIKSCRDIVAYWIRFAMYIGLAIMMGTVWLRLHTVQEDIQSYINAIFFGSAFLSFMAVAYVPAFLEDRATFVKERANGLYGPLSFMTANFLVGLPFIFGIAITFSLITYWLIDLRPGADAFFVYVMWLFLDLIAAESLVVLVSSLFPNFIVALTLVAFANGLWMSVNGFLVPTRTLNVFWRYVFHYIDYQAYVFRGMLVNEFADRTYACAPSDSAPSGCSCSFQSALADQCRIDGKAVLSFYEYKTGQVGKTVGIMIGIIAVYRLLGLIVLYLRR